MTPVLFHFLTPEGIPVANTTIEIQLVRSTFDVEDSGVLLPVLVTAITDVDGKATVDLWPSDTFYYVTVMDPNSGAGLSYKFLVPEVTVGLEVRLQDIVVVGEMSPVTYDEAALLVIQNAKALVLSYQVAAAASAASAAADVVGVGVFATTATTQAGIATTQAGIATAAAALTGADVDQTASDKIATSADRVQTGLDRIATAADRVQTALDAVATTADRVQTGLDRVATGTDRTQTALDAAGTAADRVVTTADKTQTGLDKVATAADRIQTDLDRTASSTSAAEAAASAALAASTVTGVSSVNTRTGDVVLTGADVGLGNASNTSDANKPVSTAQATADAAVQTAAATDATTKANAAKTAAATDATTKANAAQAAAIAASAPVAHVGSGGAAHANVVAAGAAGFMTGADKTKLDAITGTHTGTTSGTNTGDNAANTLYAADYRLANFVANTHYLGPGGTTTFGQPASTAMSASSSAGGLMFTAQGSGGTAGAAFCTFHRVGTYAVHFGVDIDNKLKFGGWSEGAVAYEIYHAKNIATQVLGHHTTGLGFLNKGNSGTTAQTINYASAPHQRITVTGAFVMNSVTNWPSTGNTGELLLELVNGASSAITWTMAGTTQRWWKRDGTEVATYAASGYALKANGTDWILMWSTDGGTTTNIKVQ